MKKFLIKIWSILVGAFKSFGKGLKDLAEYLWDVNPVMTVIFFIGVVPVIALCATIVYLFVFGVVYAIVNYTLVTAVVTLVLCMFIGCIWAVVELEDRRYY